MNFKLVSDYQPKGDQPQAIEGLVDGLRKGFRFQTLLGVTGSGKTYTMANVIARMNRPTLVLAHNKTLAAQLYAEFRSLFPENAVEYFVSYYDYYQPEAYIPQSDLYIEKEATINEELDRLRFSTAKSLIERRDVIVVASVSCIYGLDAPESFLNEALYIKSGDYMERDFFLRRLVDMQYERNDIELKRGRFRVRGDTVEVIPSNSQQGIRVEFFGDQIERITEIDPLLGKKLRSLPAFLFYPAKHFVTGYEKRFSALSSIEEELKERLAELKSQGKLLEAYRLEQRTKMDLEMLREFGYCPGIENYSRHLAGRKPGERPSCLIDYFPKDFLTFIDESHITVPQLVGMYEGDRSRKETLVEFGFRLPSCLDNRPLKWDEFLSLLNQVIFVSATPGPFELQKSQQVVEQLIRPTGLVDPEIEVRPMEGAIDDLIEEIKIRSQKGERVLVTTLTKRMAEELSDYLTELGLKVKYLHSEIDTINRVVLLRDLRRGKYDCLVGVNLLREGLDLPEVSLMAILDADREGFLRSERSLIQMIGRTARNVSGKVLMYADSITESMSKAILETNRRRMKQVEYNQKHNIRPESIRKAIHDLLEVLPGQLVEEELPLPKPEALTAEEAQFLIMHLEEEMMMAAEILEFEKAAQIRDRIFELKSKMGIK
ncbi:MAG: excinuclease ABC subunit UvrB [Caldiserica bacterium]|nr:excinuclease ABC subunit UvrB [Caldisericota bacterium]MDH7562730.1 excinuclease ABC subunit UvrB [Caldisericota bacterium]